MNISFSGFLKFMAVAVFSVLVFVWVGYAQAAETAPNAAKVQATLNLQPEKIQPGSSVQFSVIILNAGEVPLPEGELYVRYSLIKPLDAKSKGTLFESEKQPFAALKPGQEETISFKETHKLPTVIDFIRDDWLMHEYQVVYVKGNEEKVISTLPLTFSVHYYPAFKQKTPVKSL